MDFEWEKSMSKVKQLIKSSLQNIQIKEYQRELSSQMRDYDSWIRGQEAPLLVPGHTTKKSENVHSLSDYTWENCCKCLTNESKSTLDEGLETKNAGEDAKSLSNVISYQVFRKSRQDSTKSPVLSMLSMNAGQFWQLREQICDGRLEEDLLLLNFQDGTYSELAIPMLADAYLNRQDNLALLYGDEDVIRDAKRQDPWLKPDWSPDTFLSGFYLGAFVALPTVKVQAFQERTTKCTKNPPNTENANDSDKNIREISEAAVTDMAGVAVTADADSAENDPPLQEIYEFLAEYLYENGAFTGWKTADGVVCHIPQVLYHTECSSYEIWKNRKLSQTQERCKLLRTEAVTVSVIIPSKDHPEILFRCLDSFLEKTEGLESKIKLRFIIVDNGSSKENKDRVEQKLSDLNKNECYSCCYLYKELPFNFSYMCNWGAKEADGDYLLFLNDDMEIVDGRWLELLLEKAELPYVGAVGVKLLYPDTDIIQHAGITNLRVGPAHKLQFAHDTEDHYFGQNRGVHDMLGVTGACLLVRKAIFEQVGGFDETLAVAFNDVDLCYKIYEEGYYNVVRNDTFLFHHESLSRGKDGESSEKQLRLLREKDYLYEKHQELYGRDPFYHPYLTTDMLETEYTPAFRYQVDLTMPWSKVRNCTKEVQSARQDDCLVIGMECAMDIYKWKYGVPPEKRRKGYLESKNVGKTNNVDADNKDDKGYYFQGYSFVIGSDNARYHKELLLKRLTGEEEQGAGSEIYSLSLVRKCREDIKANLKDQIHVDLTGYAAKLKPGEVPPGTYRFGMLAKDGCSRVKLVNWSSWTIEV